MRLNSTPSLITYLFSGRIGRRAYLKKYLIPSHLPGVVLFVALAVCPGIIFRRAWGEGAGW